MIYTNPEINPYLKLPLRACINPKTLSRREGGGGGGGDQRQQFVCKKSHKLYFKLILQNNYVILLSHCYRLKYKRLKNSIPS